MFSGKHPQEHGHDTGSTKSLYWLRNWLSTAAWQLALKNAWIPEERESGTTYFRFILGQAVPLGNSHSAMSQMTA